MKKIGMLSFHDSLSFGGTLQCYALQTVLKKQGYDAEFINFRRHECTDSKVKEVKVGIKEQIKSKIIYFVQTAQGYLTRKNDNAVSQKFDNFKQNNIAIGKRKYTSMQSLYDDVPEYDIYMTGSDQVWNPNSDFLKVYGLGFVPEEKNTIAYGASIGVTEIPKEREDYLKNNIKKTRHMSCREYEGALALEKLLGREVKNVLDPTLLLTKEEWEKKAKPIDIPEKYVLGFFLGSLDYPRKAAKKIADANGCKLLIIPGSPVDIFTKGKYVKGCGPAEFLYLFKHAEFICTDSFHGTAFSINLQKNFYAFCRRGYNEKSSYISRLKDLVEILGISERLIYPDSNIDEKITKIDYEPVKKKLEHCRKLSIDFLTEALSD